ncbi:CMRF35-like molecule 8 [Hoplias malabaricus]|uniref:CMRF35-like molecule 8 n=1 Tax=Hoplias malabaricus TaxID=27720 RepID=UPI003462EA87
MRDLTVEDSGTYQCALDVTQSLDRYTPVELNVEEGECLNFCDPKIIIQHLNFGKSISVTGRAGGSVNISCKYPQSLRSYPKFLCRRMGHGGCVYKTPVKESGEWINQGKYSLHDDRVKNTLSVIISDVREEDSGEFWCGAELDWESDDGYKLYITHISLTVTASSITPQTSTRTSTTTTSKKTAPELIEDRCTHVAQSPPGGAVYESVPSREKLQCFCV